jgi:hypothetical protein
MLVLWLKMVYALGAIFIYYSLYSLISGQPVGFGYGEKHQLFESNLMQIELPLSIITGLLFLIWFWRVYANFHVLHPEKASFTGKWAILGWFVPLLNLYRPFVILREIWLENQEVTPEAILEKRYRWVIWWWAFFLLYIVIILIKEVLIGNVANGVVSWQTIYFTLICKYFLIVILAALTIMLVFKINQSEQKLREEDEGLDIYDHLVMVKK